MIQKDGKHSAANAHPRSRETLATGAKIKYFKPLGREVTIIPPKWTKPTGGDGAVTRQHFSVASNLSCRITSGVSGLEIPVNAHRTATIAIRQQPRTGRITLALKPLGPLTASLSIRLTPQRKPNEGLMCLFGLLTRMCWCRKYACSAPTLLRRLYHSS